MLKVFLAAEVVLAATLGVVFLAGTVADNWVPILAVGGSIMGASVSPVILSNLNNRAAERRAAQAADIAERAQRRKEEREDEVAARVLKAAGLTATAAEALVVSNKEVAEKVSEVADTAATSAAAIAEKVSEVASAAASSAASTDTKLDELASGQQQIHALVNSNYTASLDGKLVALRATHVALTTLAALQESGGESIFRETRQQATEVSKAVKLLEAEIDDRQIATEQAHGTLEKTLLNEEGH